MHLIYEKSSIPVGMEVRYALTKSEPHKSLEREKILDFVKGGVLKLPYILQNKNDQKDNLNMSNWKSKGQICWSQ